MYSLKKRMGIRAWAPAGVVLSLSASWALGVTSAPAAPTARGYELVSPPDLGTHAFASRDVGTSHAVAVDGSKVLWSIRVALPGVDSGGGTDTYLSRRSSSEWTSTYVSPPGSAHAIYGNTLMWESPNLDQLIWQTYWGKIDPADHDPDPDPTQAIDRSQYEDLYRRDSDGHFTWLSRGSQAPPVASELNGLIGASSDGQTVVFNDTRALEPGATSSNNVYERKGDTTTLVSVDENGAAVDASGVASSDDGGTVVFRTGASNGLYIRDRGLTRTINLQASLPVALESLSRDGHKLSLVSDAPLTSDDTDTSTDLFEYDTTTESFTRLSKPDGSSGTGPGNTDACGTPLPGINQCAIAPVATSSDGSKTYFASPERLDGSKGVDGGVNLYLAQGGTVRFVATLDSSDPDFGTVNGAPFGTPAARHIRFTPDGSKLLFESRARVTSYDNAGHVEIYLHDPADGSVTCVSCRPDGTPPSGDASLRDGTGGSRVQFSQEPASPANADEHAARVFFMSTDTIVPQDINRQYDVYEHTVATGETKLISTGTSVNDSIYLGNGLDGKDVFFFTTDTLDPRDRNGALFKLYDAREGGGWPPPAPPSPPCVAEGCRGPAAPVPGISPSGTGLTGTGTSTKPDSGGQFTPRAKLSVSGAKTVRGATARLSVKLSGPGRLRVSGAGVVGTTLTAKKAATYRVTLRLSRRARATLRRAGRLSASVTFRFTPSVGAARSARVRMTFISTSKKGRA